MRKTSLRGQSALRDFIASEAAGGIALILASALAMLAANLPGIAPLYLAALHAEIGPAIGHRHAMTLHDWINDGLMAVFFLFVGLEIKREFLDGRLATWERRLLPGAAAAAGMIVPALVYLAVTWHVPALHAGWAIPAATDIAFAIGVLALLGRHAPAPLKLFLTTVAIVDDMGAVAIIAIAYTASLDLAAIAGAALVLGGMFALNRLGVRRLGPYLALAALLWVCVLLSGVHATIAGVLAATAIPIVRSPGASDQRESPLHRLEHALDGWVAFGIVPLFGFANAGVPLAGIGPGVLAAPLPLGIALGLVLGKQAGIFGSVWAAERLGIARRPGNARWSQIYGMALLAGIGFTMSLFIGGLAFPGAALMDAEVKIGVLAGSIVSAIAGYAVLRLARGPRR